MKWERNILASLLTVINSQQQNGHLISKRVSAKILLTFHSEQLAAKCLTVSRLFRSEIVAICRRQMICCSIGDLFFVIAINFEIFYRSS